MSHEAGLPVRVSSLPCRMLVLLVHPGDKFIAQEVVLLSLWSVESLWLAEHFLLLTGPLAPPLLKCPPFDSLVTVDALHIQEFWLSLEGPSLIAKAAAVPAAKR